MAFTDKQVRNGAAAEVAAHNPAIPGPDTSAVIAAAIAATMADPTYQSTVFTVRHGDSVVDWETGVAGHDMPGEA